jgi:group I intron endonuclease
MNVKSITNNAGIYKITNKITKKIYIGSAVNIRIRWKSHRNGLRHNKHPNKYLQASYNIHGYENFIYEIVEFMYLDNLTLSEKRKKLSQLEQYYLDTLKPYDRNIGYNLLKTAIASPLGTKHSEISKKNMSKAHVGFKHSNETKRKISESQYKKVYQLDKKGNVVAEYGSCVEAELKTGILRQLISMCCRGITKSAKKFYWTYDLKSYIIPEMDKKMKKVSDGIKTWDSIRDLCRELKITRQQFYRKLKKNKFFYEPIP